MLNASTSAPYPGQEFYTGQNVGAGQTATIKSLPHRHRHREDQKGCQMEASYPVGDSQGYQLDYAGQYPADRQQQQQPEQPGNSFNLGENIAGFHHELRLLTLTEHNTSADGFGIDVRTPDARSFTGGSGRPWTTIGTTPSMQHSVGIFFNTYDGASANANATGIAHLNRRHAWGQPVD